MSADTRSIMLIDCDGILADLVGTWFKRHNAQCQVCTTPLTVEMVTAWETHQFTACEKHVYSYLEEPTLWRDLRPIREAQRVLPRMVKYIRPVVVTAVTSGPEARFYRVQWLRRHFPCIDPGDIVITTKKQCVSGDILLDDAIHNLRDHTAEGLVLDYPWNRNFSDATRVFNWHEVEQRVREYLEIGVPDGRSTRSLRHHQRRA